MPTFKDLFSLHVKYTDFVSAKSLMTHQYINNYKLSGDGAEEQVRSLLRSFLPSRYKVTHGYIAAAPSHEQEPLISPQVDVIIVDTHVPHQLFLFDEKGGEELVPESAVVGIFEVKRTLNKRSLVGTKAQKGAIEHLSNILNSIGINKRDTNRYSSAGEKQDGIIKGIYHHNPIVGVLSISHSKTLEQVEKFDQYHREAIEKTNKEIVEIDLFASIDGLLVATCSDDSPQLGTLHETWDKFRSYFIIHANRHQSKALVLSRTLGFVFIYLTLTTGIKNTLQNFFFNETIT